MPFVGESARDSQIHLSAKRPEAVARRQAVLQPDPDRTRVELVGTVESRFARVVAVDEADVGREDGGNTDAEGDPTGTGGRLRCDGGRCGQETAQPEEKPGQGGNAAALRNRRGPPRYAPGRGDGRRWLPRSASDDADTRSST